MEQLQPVNQAQPTLQQSDVSNFELLNSIFKAKISVCDRNGNIIPGQPQIVAAALDGKVSTENNYSSPFDNASPEQKLPNLLGMMQTGLFTNTLAIGLSNLFDFDLSDDQKNVLNSLQGRSSVTKLNSTQMFVSNAPMQISMTLLFYAWKDAAKEVEEQVTLLHTLSMPESLSDGSFLANATGITGFSDVVSSLFPSLVPPCVSLTYANKRYAPFLIQNFSRDIVGNMTREGNMLTLEIPLTLVSINSLDAGDILNQNNL